MILFVDLEHERVAATDQWQSSFALRLKIQYRLEDLSGEPCLTLRYNWVTPEVVARLQPSAVVISGCATEIDFYTEADLAGLRAVIRACAQPTLGFCGGLQLIGETFGAPLAPMGPLPAGAPDPYPEWGYGSGMRRERGFMPVSVLKPHPLMDGLGPTPMLFESHYWELKTVPAGFTLVASTAECPVQLIAHERLPLYGTQFHPEQWDEAHPDGSAFLRNFFQLVQHRIPA